MKHPMHVILLLTAALAVLASSPLQADSILESPFSDGDGRFVLNDGAKVVDGGIEVDTSAISGEFHEYFKTVPAKVNFIFGKPYVISYDYTVNKVGDDKTEFYHLLRSTEGDADVGMKLWTDAAGRKGHKEFTATLESANYRLILGVRFKGAIRIENLKIREAAAKEIVAEDDSILLNLPPVAAGPFQPNWNSLLNYQVPEWFRDAKFGIWAHWGPQCEAERGDWFARNMYMKGKGGRAPDTGYLHPSEFGFKDVIHAWKAEKFDPDQLVKFYKDNGAKYFMAMANHHDNFDNYDSKYQPWNSVKVGPKKDLIGGWAAAARKHGLRFGVSVHASRAWSWYEPAQGTDETGPYAGKPYDGKLTKADGKGKWWDGLDPQDLYAQNHTPGKKFSWTWDRDQGSSWPDSAYMENFFKRTQQLWDDYHPDQIYFDDTVLPFHGITDKVGLNLAVHFYNTRLNQEGVTEAVMNGKGLSNKQRRAMVYDIERGKANAILPQPWETSTCLGQWHYNKAVLDQHLYKSAASVIRLLCDIVSKNGNLLLSVPLQRDGQPDAEEIKIVNEIGAWLKLNGEAIYATRPWQTFGEGPSATNNKNGQGGAETDTFTPEDIRFTQSKDGQTLYAIVLEIPKDGKVAIKSLGNASPNWPGKIRSVRLLGGGELKFTRDENGLHVLLPKNFTGQTALALKITS